MLKKVIYRAKNNQEGLSVSAEIVYPKSERAIVPMSEYGNGLYEVELSFKDNTTYVVRVAGKDKLYDIGDTTIGQSGDSFIRIRNKSDLDVFVYTLLNGIEKGIRLKHKDETLITLNAYRLQIDDQLFTDHIEVLG